MAQPEKALPKHRGEVFVAALFAVVLVCVCIFCGPTLFKQIPGIASNILSGGNPAESTAAVSENNANASDSGAVVLDRESQETEVSVVMIGDVLVHRGVWESGEHSDGTRNYDHLFAQVAPDISSADVAIVNQETVLGGADLGFSGYPTFNSPQEIGDAEVTAGFDVVLQASNHALDKGQAGIDNALVYWREKHPDVAAIGVAKQGEQLNSMGVIERNGVKIAVLNYTFSTNGIPLPENNANAVSMLSESQIAHDVQAARDQGADIVIACPHWGEEYQNAPNESQKHWAQVFADNGVDVVIGTHPHVMQPVEMISRSDGGETLVFWSLGNFVSTQPTAGTMVGGMAKVTLAKDEFGSSIESWELVPVITQRLSGSDLTTYPLSAYTDELAQANGIRGVDGSVDFSLPWIKDYCAQVLGSDFSKDACVLRGSSTDNQKSAGKEQK